MTYSTFPRDFRMLAGNTTKRTWNGPLPVPPRSLWTDADMTQEALAEKAIGFNCLHYDLGWNEGALNVSWIRDKEFLDAFCYDGLRAEILFPSCWDGIHLDSKNHRDHVRYPRLLESGLCPDSHPVYLPILFYEVVWMTQQFRDLPGRYVFSNGDPTGFGYHADFMAAWEDEALDAVAVDPSCTDQNIIEPTTNGQIELCSSLNVQSPEEAAQCRLMLPPELDHEVVYGELDGLPGNVPIVGFRHDPRLK